MDHRSANLVNRRWLGGLCWLAAASWACGAEPPAVEVGRPIARLGVPRLQIGYPLAFAADGKTFLGISPDGDIVRHDAATGAEVERIKLPDERPLHSLSADGTRCLVTSRRDFKVWHLTSGRRLLDVAPRGLEVRCELSPDGKLVASQTRVAQNDQWLSVWDVETGKEQVLAREPFNRFFFSADGKWLVAWGWGDDLRCWDLASGRVVWTKKMRAEKMAISPDGKTLLVADFPKGWQALDTATGNSRDDLKLPNGVPYSRPIIAPDNRTLVLPLKNGVVLWDLKEGRARHTLPGTSRDTVFDQQFVGGFSPDGKSLLTMFGTPQSWDLETGKPMLSDADARGHTSPAVSLAFSPDGKRLASAAHDDQTVRVWELPSGRLLHTMRGHTSYIRSVQFTQDGSRLVSGGGDSTVRIWDPATGRELTVLHLHDEKNRGGHEQVGTMYIHPDGRRLTVVSILAFRPAGTTAMSIWDLKEATRLLSRLAPFDTGKGEWDDSVCNRDLTPDGAAMVKDDGRVIAINGSDARPRLDFNAAVEQPYYPILSRDGRFAAAQIHAEKRPDGPHRVDVWELATGRRLARLPTRARSLLFAPSAPYLLAAEERALTLWDLRTTKPVRQFPINVRKEMLWCHALAISPDGKTAAVAMHDSTILLLDLSVLRDLAAPLSAAELTQAWEDLANPDAAKGYAASLRLAGSPAQAARIIGDHIRPVEAFSAQRIAALVARLDDAEYAKRQAAERELLSLGERVMAPLRAALPAVSSAEVKKRIEAILATQSDAAAPPLELLRAIRAIFVLEQIGTPEARRVVERLAAGAESARLTREAKLSLAIWRK
jgi:WD40 repeat protein